MSPIIDLPDQDSGPGPGVRYIELRRVEYTGADGHPLRSRAGDPQVVLHLYDVDTGKPLGRDWLTFMPGFADALACKKLSAFGINLPAKNRRFDPELLCFRRAYCAFIANTYKNSAGEERTGLKVNDKLGTGGYWPETSPPPEYHAPEQPTQQVIEGYDQAAIDSTPF